MAAIKLMKNRGTGTKHAAVKKPLPFLGPIAFYLPIQNGRPGKSGLSRELRLIAEAEVRVLRGEFVGMDRFYAAIPKDGRNFLNAAVIALFGAVGSDDPFLFDTIIKDIAAYPSRYGSPEAKLAVGIVMVWLRNFLHVQKECPEWLARFDLSSIPGEWRRQVAYLGVMCLVRRGEYMAAEVLSESLLNLDAGREVRSPVADMYLMKVKAIICREEGRMNEASQWCHAVVGSAKPTGIVLPFLGVMMGPKSAMERALVADAPELLAKIKKLTNGYFRNLVKYHNRFTGEKVSEDLRPREFYIARLVKRGVRYKEIAERTGMSEGRVRNAISEIYDILHIGRGAEIGNLVW